ncbi:MAG: HPF/RaiA family ribosome-associated protein [Bacteroidia bacterium]
MLIQFNTQNNTGDTEGLREPFTQFITDALSRFKEQVTRIEVHLADENGSSKSGQNDKRCMMEARLEGMQPIAVTNHSDSYDLALKGAVDKLKASLDKSVERLRNY